MTFNTAVQKIKNHPLSKLIGYFLVAVVLLLVVDSLLDTQAEQMSQQQRENWVVDWDIQKGAYYGIDSTNQKENSLSEEIRNEFDTVVELFTTFRSIDFQPITEPIVVAENFTERYYRYDDKALVISDDLSTTTDWEKSGMYLLTSTSLRLIKTDLLFDKPGGGGYGRFSETTDPYVAYFGEGTGDGGWFEIRGNFIDIRTGESVSFSESSSDEHEGVVHVNEKEVGELSFIYSRECSEEKLREHQGQFEELRESGSREDIDSFLEEPYDTIQFRGISYNGTPFMFLEPTEAYCMEGSLIATGERYVNPPHSIDLVGVASDFSGLTFILSKYVEGQARQERFENGQRFSITFAGNIFGGEHNDLVQRESLWR